MVDHGWCRDSAVSVMSANNAGFKAGRRERHLAREAKNRERKMLRKARAARFAHLPGQRPDHGSDRVAPKPGKYPLPALAKMDMPRLRGLATDAGCEVRSRHRKADLIAMIEAAYEARA